MCAEGDEILHEASVRRHHGPERSASGGEDLLALLAQLALRPDVPVERHGPDPEFAAECGHGRVTVRHRSLGQPHLGFRQREHPAAVATARPRGREPGQGAFADQLPRLITTDSGRTQPRPRRTIWLRRAARYSVTVHARRFSSGRSLAMKSRIVAVEAGPPQCRR